MPDPALVDHLLTHAVKTGDFKTCSQAGFCRRGRADTGCQEAADAEQMAAREQGRHFATLASSFLLTCHSTTCAWGFSTPGWHVAKMYTTY